VSVRRLLSLGGILEMRYLLLVLGLLCAGGGVFLLTAKPAGVDGPAVELRYALLVQAGAVFLAAGLVTIDIVEALKSRR
jgi:hypothetical protein